MVHIKPQFTNLLASITIALAAVSTVEARPQDDPPASIDSSAPDIGIDLARKAPLMRRGGGGSGASRARMARQLEAAALFEASRLAHAKERRARAAKVRSSDDPGEPVSADSIEVKRDHRHHHHHHHHGHHHGHHHHHHHRSHHHHHTHGHDHDHGHYDGTKVYADDPLIISGDHNHVHSHSHKRDRTVVDADDPVVITGNGNHVHTHSHGGHHHKAKSHHHHGHHKHHHHHHHAHDRETTVLADSPLIVSGEGNHVHSHSHKRHHPDGHSKGGHSEHWFEHHGLKAESHHHRHHGHHHHHHHGHHHHHHHHHGKRSRPNRLSDNEADTFIAPPSARPVVEADLSKVKSKASEDGTGGRMMKRPKSQTGDGKASGNGKDWDESDSDDEDEKGHKKWDKRDEGSIVSGAEPSEPNATGPSDNKTASGISGVIDLMRGWPDGEKVGGLSISAFPNDTANGASIHNSTSISVLIDSTPNLSEQTTFFMHELEDQSLLDAEHPATRAVRDLLVSLEVPYMPNMTDPEAQPSEEVRMCATFNPLEPSVQTFGLALCMDQESATNDRRMSQAFRYSSDTGVLKPYYGAGVDRQTVLAAVNKRISEMDSGEAEATGWTGTGVYDLDPNVATPPGFEPNSTDSNTALEPNPFSAELNATVPIPLAPSSMLDPLAAPLPGTNATDAQDSAPTPDAAPTTLLAARHTRRALIIGASPEVETASSEDMGVIMAFRSDDETWRHTKDDVEMMEEPDKVSGEHQEVKLTRPEDVDKPKNTDAASSKTSNSDGKKKSFDSTDPEDDAPIHKPVAFFAESGRSAPVPPEEQADIVHPILLADPGSIHPSPKLAIADPKEPNAEEDVTPVFLSAPSHEESTPGVMAAVPEHKAGPMGIPIDASD